MQNGARSFNAASLHIGDCKALPVRMRPVTREISGLHTDAADQGRGDATTLMHRVCREADDQGITLLVWPNPFGDDMAMGRTQLIAWYARRFGFVQIQAAPPMMARMPWSTPQTLTPIASAAVPYAV